MFITYNPGAVTEENLALRLQTLSNLYGVLVELPDRLGVGQRQNTETRIARADYVVAFCLGPLSSQLQDDLKIALGHQKPIIVVYDKRVGKTIDFKGYDKQRDLFIDFEQDKVDEVLANIRDYVVRQSGTKSSTKPSVSDKDVGVLALLAVALGLFALAMSSDKK